MEIKKITTEELKRVTIEGLVIQGCGGDLTEWVDGINEMLTESGILQNGAKFTDVKAFEHEELTNLLFNMDGVDLNVGKLAMWRLATHENFSGKWLSDYLPNRLGVEMGEVTVQTEKEKPDCELIGQDGNVFNLMGIASRTLRRAGQSEEATEMCERIRDSGSYHDALNIIGEYVNITGPEEQSCDFGMKGFE